MKLKDKFEPFIEYRAKIGNCKKTINEITRFLGHPIYEALGEREIKSIRLIDTAEVQAAGRKHGIHGECRAVSYYRQYLEYLHRSGVKLHFDWHDILIPKVAEGKVEYLEPTEINQIRDCFDVNDDAGLRTRALIEFLIDSGLRIGEACSVDVKDIDFDKKELQVRNIKTKEWGTAYLTDRSIEWLKMYLENRKWDHDALFVTGRSRMLPVTSRNFIRSKTKHLPFAKRICHHVFRRTLGTTLAHERVDIKTVQEILRHKSERTTLKYYIGTNKERSKHMHHSVVQKIFG